MTDFQKRKLIIIIANILSFLIIITMVLTSKNLSLKASDDTEWYIVEAEYEEPICEDPDGTFTYTEETIYLDEIESVQSNLDVTLQYYYEEEPYYGMVIYILSDVGGARYDLSYQWYYSDGNEWIIIPDATDSIYSFILNEDNAYYRWKLIVKENVPIIIEENNIKEKENLPLIENSDIVNIELIEECEIIEE